MDQTIITIFSIIFSFGAIYGMFNARIKNVEKSINDHHNLNERLTRIEEKTNLLINHFIK